MLNLPGVLSRGGWATRAAMTFDPANAGFRIRAASNSRYCYAGGVCCTSRKHNTHITESREVLYRWHPWFGRMAWIFNVVEKNGEVVLRCALDPLETASVTAMTRTTAPARSSHRRRSTGHIPSITAGHSLFPRSCARTAMGRPCGLLSPKGAIRGFHVPLAEVRRVRCLLLTGRPVGHESAWWKRQFPSPLPFWFKRSSHFRLFYITIFSAGSDIFTIPTI
jgi:hypothetical protein